MVLVLAASLGECVAGDGKEPDAVRTKIAPTTAARQNSAMEQVESDDTPQDRSTDAAAVHELLCEALVREAVAHDLPVEFFASLIWKESRLDPQALSPRGAAGIAQFMPKTASWRGLIDPYEPQQALRESASPIRDLRVQFGNLGLAAAAYNARGKAGS